MGPDTGMATATETDLKIFLMALMNRGVESNQIRAALQACRGNINFGSEIALVHAALDSEAEWLR